MLDLPTSANQVKSRIKADIRSALPISNPFTAGSWLGTLSDSIGERIYSFYYAITQLISELFPDTTNMYVQRWAGIFNILQKGASGSTGYWNYTGVLSITPGFNIVPLGSILVDENGNTYETTERTALGTKFGTATFSRAGSIYTITFADHELPTGALAVISSSGNPQLNGTRSVTVLTNTTFTVESIASGVTSGNCLVSIFTASSQIRAITPGSDTNLAPLTALSLQSGLPGVTSLGMVNPDGFTGGIDIESLPDLRERLLLRLRNPVANFNKAQIESLVLQQNSITRVFVQTVTPAIGQVTIYPLIDGSSPPIPSTVKNQEIKDVITSTIMPADISEADVFVSQAIELQVPITLTALNPNNVNMQKSITAGLRQLFETQAGVGITLTVDDIRSTINSSFDINTRLGVTSFTLSAPTASIVPASNQLPVLGTVTYPAV
jgi:uncharacterized phage protein gp47/JayE